MKGWRVLIVGSIIILSIFLQAHTCLAQIPEPHNIFYGMAILNGELVTAESLAVITLKIDPYQYPIASYTMGANPDAGDFYVLRVPLYSHAPQDPDKAQHGDEAYIYINDLLAGTVTIGPRASIQMIHLNTSLEYEDSDGDGLPDSLEMALGTDPDNSDTDGDGLPDALELILGTDPNNSDTDGDGFSDGDEVNIHGTDPLTADSIEIDDIDNDNDNDGLVDEEGAETTFELDLPSGWSMVSLPVFPESFLLDDLFPGAEKVYSFDQGEYQFIHHTNELEFGRAYWVFFSEPRKYQIPGISITSYTIDIDRGWSMIGSCSSLTRISANQPVIEAIFGAQNTYQLFGLEDYLEPGQGYWIFSDKPTQITVTGTGLLAGYDINPGEDFEESSGGWSLEISAAVENEAGIFNESKVIIGLAGKAKTALSPPAPPESPFFIKLEEESYPSKYYFQDIRKMGRDREVWVLKVEIDEALFDPEYTDSYPVLTWGPVTISDALMLRKGKNEDGEILVNDMSQANFYSNYEINGSDDLWYTILFEPDDYTTYHYEEVELYDLGLTSWWDTCIFPPFIFYPQSSWPSFHIFPFLIHPQSPVYPQWLWQSVNNYQYSEYNSIYYSYPLWWLPSEPAGRYHKDFWWQPGLYPWNQVLDFYYFQ